MTKNIIKKQSSKPGPTVAIFCGVHGNELAGIKTVDCLVGDLEPECGTVYLVYANPNAIDAKVRFTEKNLNRCFIDSSLSGSTYEEKLAVELMGVLDTCDALLDLHAYNEPNGEATPFAITESNAQSLVNTFDLPFVIYGIDEVEKGGTDAYMSNQNKIGICVELGAISEPDKYVDLGIQTAYQFMQYFGIAKEKFKVSNQKQTILKADDIYFRKNEDFLFSKKFMTFDKLEMGQIICRDGEEDVYAEKDSYILFPGGNNPVGVEAYMTATKISRDRA